MAAWPNKPVGVKSPQNRVDARLHAHSHCHLTPRLPCFTVALPAAQIRYPERPGSIDFHRHCHYKPRNFGNPLSALWQTVQENRPSAGISAPGTIT